MLRQIIKHTREGTLVPAISRRIAPPQPKVARWDSATSATEAINYLVGAAETLVKSSGMSAVLLMGNSKDPFYISTLEQLTAAGIVPHELEHGILECESLAGIICCYQDARSINTAARIAKDTPALSALPFEFKIVRGADYEIFLKRSLSNSDLFISPLLSEPIDFFEIYEESLTRFDLKCDIRDYMDLCQIVKMVVTNGIPGPVAEFGSFKGHSGYLLADCWTHLAQISSCTCSILLQRFQLNPWE